MVGCQPPTPATSTSPAPAISAISAAILARTDFPEDVRKVLASVERSFLGAAFDATQTDYGGVEGYLSDGLDLDAAQCARLQERYLES